MRDAYHQYLGGIVDKTDYEEAMITLNNSKAQLKQATENVRPQYATLKQQMGFPPEKEFNVSFDTAQMMKEITFDTTQQLQYEKRIEYQLLETSKNLQQQNINYYRYNFLPTVSASMIITMSLKTILCPTFSPMLIPIRLLVHHLVFLLFTGFARLKTYRKPNCKVRSLHLNEVNLKSVIYSQYTSAMANYKSNVYDLYILQNECFFG